MIAESVAFLRRAGQARDLRRRALLRRLRRRPRATRSAACAPRPRRAPRPSSAATPTAGRSPTRSPRRWPRWSRRSAEPASRSGSTATTTPAAASPTRWPPSQAGATHVQGTMNGYGERCGNANLVTIIPNLQLKLGYECLDRGAARGSSPRPRTSSTSCSTSPPTPTSPTSAATRSPTRAGCTSPGSPPTRRRSSTSSPRSVGNRRELLISELSGKGTVHVARPRRRDRARRRGRRAGRRAGQGARAPRLPLRGGRRLVRAAAAQGDRRVRAAVPARVLAGDRREARRRPRRDRGDDQDLGRRRALRPHRRGQRPGQRAGPGAARGARSRSIPHLRDIELVNFKVRILDETKGTGAVTRVLLDASDGDRVWGSIGVSENVIEASWEALVDSLEYGMQPGDARPRCAGAGDARAHGHRERHAEPGSRSRSRSR